MDLKQEIADLHYSIRQLEVTRMKRVALQKREKASGLSEHERERLAEIVLKQVEAESDIDSEIERVACYLSNLASTDKLRTMCDDPSKVTDQSEHAYAVKRVARRALALSRLAEPLQPGVLLLTPDVVSIIKQQSVRFKTDPSTLLRKMFASNDDPSDS